jgi:hypothetical protein
VRLDPGVFVAVKVWVLPARRKLAGRNTPKLAVPAIKLGVGAAVLAWLVAEYP